jgi:hypothetical protein
MTSKFWKHICTTVSTFNSNICKMSAIVWHYKPFCFEVSTQKHTSTSPTSISHLPNQTLSTNVATVKSLSLGQNQFDGIHMAMKCMYVYYFVPIFFHHLCLRLVNLSSMKTLTKLHTPNKYTFMPTSVARTVDSLIFKATHTQSYRLTIFQNHLSSWNKEIDI